MKKMILAPLMVLLVATLGCTQSGLNTTPKMSQNVLKNLEVVDVGYTGGYTIGTSINVNSGFLTQAVTPRELADVTLFDVNLYTTNDLVNPVKTHSTAPNPGVITNVQFNNVPPNAFPYVIKVAARDGINNIISDGGTPTQSTNNVTIADGSAPVYSTGTSLVVTLQLFNGVGDSTSSAISVNNGNAIPPVTSNDL